MNFGIWSVSSTLPTLVKEMESYYKGKIRFTDSSEGFKAIIKADRNWFAVICFSIALVPLLFSWLLVAMVIYRGFPRQSTAPLLNWFVAWTLICVFVIRTCLWHTQGKTIVTIKLESFIVEKKMDMFNRKKTYRLNRRINLYIQNRDIETNGWMIRRNYMFTSKTKTVAFNYENKTIRLVDWLRQEEAELLISRLNKYFTNKV